ncbi:ketopantoate reductase family protein [Alteribacillus sp. JSM 102045]|uniref:ketopantoate reductase family protein n=1 Tax=Alteribacillus sp. JSM 102045 TaxID=1562101 RepID=UPI0035BFEFC1
MQSIWQKAAFNSVLNPLCTLMQSPVAAEGSYSGIDSILEELLHKILMVAEAEGVPLEKEKIKQIIHGVFDPDMSGKHISSMYHDIQNSRKTEIEYLNGAILEKAEKQ